MWGGHTERARALGRAVAQNRRAGLCGAGQGAAFGMMGHGAGGPGTGS